MTFQDILDQVAQRLNYTSGLTTAAQTRMLGYLNNRHRQLLSRVGAKLRDVIGAPILTTVSGQQLYALPPSVKAIKQLYEPKTLRFVYPVDASLIRRQNPGGASVNFGLPARYADIGYIAYQREMPSANALYVVSTLTTDNASRFASVEYFRTGGYRGSANVALNGLTPVQLGTDSDIVRVTKFYISDPVSGQGGFVTLRAANGTGTTISTLGPGQTYARFRGVLLDPTPNANVTYSLDYTRTIPDALVNSNDEPLIDEDFQWILVSGVMMDEAGKNQNSAAYLLAKDEWEQGIKDLTSDVMNLDNLIVVPNRGQLPKPYPFRIPVS